MSVTLSTLAVVLGLLMVALNLYGVLRPTAFAAAARKFPRNTSIGYPLMLLATAWFIYYVYQEPIADFAKMKPYLCTLFGLVGLGTCIFVQDFLPVRGLAVLLLLAAKLMVDTARWVETDWRLVIVTWAYVWVIMGMWLTISPWRLRDMVNWATANEGRVRMLSGVRTAFGIFVVVLGVTVFKAAENKPAAELHAAPPSAVQVVDSCFYTCGQVG